MNMTAHKKYQLLALLACSGLASTAASATTLNATGGGTFTINFDRDAFASMNGGSVSGTPGIFNDRFYNAAESNYTTQSGAALLAGRDNVESNASQLVHTLTGTTALTGQAASRHAQATSSNFSIDSNTLAGVGQLGMLGVQAISIGVGFYAGGGMVYGDYSLKYDSDLSTWYLQNNIYFAANPYDLANLVLTVTDASNWRLSGDLLMTEFNAGMLGGVTGSDVGNFCLGVGSYSGCAAAAPAAVPVPGAVWLMGSALGLFGAARRRHRLV